MRQAKLGKKASEATKQKMSEARKGYIVTNEVREKISLAKKGKNGKPHSQEWKDKISAKLSGENNPNYGKPMSEEQKRKISEHTKRKRQVIKMSLDGEIIKTYSSIKEAERDTGAYNQNIIACCKGKKPTAKGFKWAYA